MIRLSIYSIDYIHINRRKADKERGKLDRARNKERERERQRERERETERDRERQTEQEN